MATVSEIYRVLDTRIPRALSCDWDNDGMMVCGDAQKEVKKVLFALDITDAVIAYAEESGADLILSHHPLLFRPIAHLDGENFASRKAIRLLRRGMAAMSFHTRFDAVSGGMNDLLAARFSLRNAVPFGPAGEQIGRVGDLPTPMALPAFCRLVKETLRAPTVSAADSGREIRRVAVLGGAGGDDIGDAKAAGADVLLTGEAGYNRMLDAAQDGISVVTAGHYHTEALFVEFFEKLMKEHFPTVKTEEFPGGSEILTV